MSQTRHLRADSGSGVVRMSACQHAFVFGRAAHGDLQVRGVIGRFERGGGGDFLAQPSIDAAARACRRNAECAKRAVRSSV